MSEWISVNKYLPPFHERVLIYIDHIEADNDICIGYLEVDGNFYFNEIKEKIECIDVYLITHWMRLPLSPKAEDNE